MMMRDERMTPPDKYEPLIAMLRDLGADMGACESRALNIDAPVTSRHLCTAFASHGQSVEFMQRLGGDDQARKRDIAMAIGVSKCERNVITNALQFLCDFAFEEAKKNLVGRIGKDLNGYKQRLADKLAGMDVELARVEARAGKRIDRWTANDAAMITAQMTSVLDGLTMADDVWPPPAPAEPKRGDTQATDATHGSVAPVAADDVPQTRPAAEFG